MSSTYKINRHFNIVQIHKENLHEINNCVGAERFCIRPLDNICVLATFASDGFNIEY